MNRPSFKSLLTLALTSTLLLSGTAQAKIVCWTNSEGVRECGNAVPPEYAQKEVHTINDRGITTDVKKRAKTKEELATEKAQKEEEERLAAEEAARQKEQKAYDRVLLSTFLSEDEIERARKRKLGSIDATIEITHITIDRLMDKLNADKKKAASAERKGQQVPEKLQASIESLQTQISEKKAFIQRKEEEKGALNVKYDSDLERFRELKQNGARLR